MHKKKAGQFTYDSSSYGYGDNKEDKDNLDNDEDKEVVEVVAKEPKTTVTKSVTLVGKSEQDSEKDSKEEADKKRLAKELEARKKELEDQ